MGGITEAIVLVFAFIFIPISEHMFIVEASRKLFLARTKTEGLFKEAKNSLPEPEFDSKKACKEIKWQDGVMFLIQS